LTVYATTAANTGILTLQDSATGSVNFIPNTTVGAYNSLTMSGDQLIYFTKGPVDTGCMTIAPHYGGYMGIRIASTANTFTAAANTHSFVSNTSGTAMMTILGSGNVGIGTTSPTQVTASGTLLHVYASSSDASTVRIDSTAGTGQARLHLSSGSGAFYRASRVDFFNFPSSTGVPTFTLINDYDQNGTNNFDFVNFAGVRMMSLNQSGNVGIGTSNPSATLDIRGGSISLGSFDTSSGSKYVGLYNVNESGGPLVGMEIENTTLSGNYSQKLHFRTHWYGNNNGRRLTIDEYGNVFISKNLTTSNPYWFITHSSGGNATYTVGGGAWFSSTANATFYGNSITVGGTASASAFNPTSGTFTFPVAGTYLISVPMFINGSVGGRYAIATFGSSIKPVSQYFEFTSTNLPSNEMRTWTYVKQVNGGDTMALTTQGGSITLYLAETHSCLIIFKVG
jgi:hypothetical protein